MTSVANHGTPTVTENYFSLSTRPTSPAVLIPHEGKLYALPVHKLHCEVEFHVSTAFAKITGTWRNIAKYPSECMFCLPLQGTVTSATMKINSRLFETVVIPKKAGEGVKAAAPKEEKMKETAEGVPKNNLPYDEYIPNLFRLPIPGVQPGDEITVVVNYLEPLQFLNGHYHFTFPLQIGDSLLPKNKTLKDILSIKCIINSVTPETSYVCNTHEIEVVKEEFPLLELKTGALKDPMVGFFSNDFNIAYSIKTKDILTTLVKEENTAKDGGTFVLFVTPPGVDVNGKTSMITKRKFIRHFVFLVDRSGSMSGEPYQEATRALTAGLASLSPEDSFTIIAFDHRQELFANDLIAATGENIAAATRWVDHFNPERGGTDIWTPLQWSLKLLNARKRALGPAGVAVLPFVLMITDGCVATERDICVGVNTDVGDARILTFGIGSYCNWFFLKMLAQIGRGFSDVVVYKEKIYQQVLQLLLMAAQPVVTNVSVEIGSVKSVELYPFPIPDLFMGSPLTIAGKYAGKFPDRIMIRGFDADGINRAFNATTRGDSIIPVSKVFLKQRLDLLTAKAWLNNDVVMEEEVVELSCENSFPSAHTAMVVFETTEEQKDEMGLNDVPGGGKGGKKKAWYKNPKNMALLGLGGAVFIGAAAFSFGDVLGTSANLPGLGGNMDFGGDCCECEGCDGCDDCDCGGC